MELVVTGSIGIDTIELPDGERRENLLGGSAAYFAAAASFSTKPGIVAVAGNDLPDAHKHLLASFNIDTTGLEIRSGKTFRWGGKYHENMDERDTLFTELNVLGERPAAVPDAYKSASHVFLANAPPTVQRAFREEFPEALVVADTMDLWITTAKKELLSLLQEVDGLVLNHDEAEQLTGKRNTVAAAKHLLGLGPRFVVVKKGEHGCLYAYRLAEGVAGGGEPERIGALPAYPAEKVVDPTGAGDSFAGGLMGFLAARKKEDITFPILREALLHATVLSSFTIEAFGLGRLSLLTGSELDTRIKEYRQMLQF